MSGTIIALAGLAAILLAGRFFWRYAKREDAKLTEARRDEAARGQQSW